ncbi:hypothetical protein [Parapedobacter sp. 10938]|uniref:hypothetical protein n=1 Tax=Parapedobacter flavus TaxID=3110225 RepID=UPI002DB9AA2A|nr:hypothetical protein [Parapedobacter sp. 10938]MEC3881671.1 hypothetical protein [Parapedobacter sp. 10938]
MENLKITVECLRDLAAFHNERVAGYRSMMDSLAGDEKHLITLFNAFIAQSNAMGEELKKLGADWGSNVRDQSEGDGKYGLAWSVVKAVFSSRMPCYLLDRCRSGENALLIAYHSIEGTDGLAEPVRLLINRQKREVIAARDWIAHFEAPPQQPLHEQPVGAAI